MKLEPKKLNIFFFRKLLQSNIQQRERAEREPSSIGRLDCAHNAERRENVLAVAGLVKNRKILQIRVIRQHQTQAQILA
jgi:hypothetical protein